MRVKYIYDYEFSLKTVNSQVGIFTKKKPIACMVSDNGLIGLSVCCNNDRTERGFDTFSKKKAKEIAIGRMMTGSVVSIPNRKIYNKFGQATTLLDEFNFWASRMLCRQEA